MASNPYSNLPKSAFWKSGVTQENPHYIKDIYQKKYNITKSTKIATAGSCFAQHIAEHLKANGYHVLDVEPPPPGLAWSMHKKFGFSMYSARYGNIYTVGQLLQLTKEVAGEWSPRNYIWEDSGKYYDGLRPTIEPKGHNNKEDVIAHRQYHIARVKELFENLDLLIFTLGLTEMWQDRESGTIFPTAPGTIKGNFDPMLVEFKNAEFNEIHDGFMEFQNILRKIRKNRAFNIMLTVSPVPLTATASGKHVLVSNMYSKSILRSVAGQLSNKYSHIDYFPSYEIISNPRMHSSSYADNLRSVRDEAVNDVMSHFFNQSQIKNSQDIDGGKYDSSIEDSNDIFCEEAVLEAFGK